MLSNFYFSSVVSGKKHKQDGNISRVRRSNVERIPCAAAADAIARQPNPFAAIIGAEHVRRIQHSTER